MAGPKYIIRVSGLGSVEALMLERAQTDEAAREDVRTVLRCDPRLRVKALYRSECLLDQLGDDKDYCRLGVTRGSRGGTLYLATGNDGNVLRQRFFEVTGTERAFKHLQVLFWKKMRLYQLESIPL